MQDIHKITWQAPDHIKPERSSDWFWTVGIITIGAVILTIFFKNFLFGFVLLLGTFSLFLSAHTPPVLTDYEINRKGVKINETIYTYANLESFYIIDEDGYERDRLLLKSKKLLMPLIVLPIEDADQNEIREFLIEYLNEEELSESTAYKIMHNLGL